MMANEVALIVTILSKNNEITPLGVGHLSRAAHWPKFNISLPRSFILRPIVSSTSAQRSRSLTMLTPHGRTDGHMTGLQVISGQLTKNHSLL